VGLQPYTAAQRDYFFGRESDQRVIASNLYASRLTILYGATGVGKTSVLMAGVVPRLEAARRTAVVVFRQWQDPSFLEALKAGCVEAVGVARGQPAELDPGLPLDDLLLAASQAVRGSVLILLDQFEEYFVYHPESQADSPFEVELARAINREEVDVGFLIALREDALARLDRFRTRIPNLLASTIRLRHLSLEAAERAIRGPLQVYNRETGANVTVEDDLVSEVLRQVRTGQRLLGGAAGAGQAQEQADADEVETPFLQLVMERLWEREREEGSKVLRLRTFHELGGARQIVGRHLHGVLDAMTPQEREVCSLFFDRLVTPSGTKIAYPVDDLTKVAGGLAKYVSSALEALSRARVLRRIQLPGLQAVEIFHDVLATPILEWREDYVRAAERVRERRRLRRRIMQGAALALLLIGLLGYRAYSLWLENRPWGVLTNLSTGTAHAVTGKQFTVGRNTQHYQNQVNLLPNTISRLHLMIFRNLVAIDMRSYNGTTVNAAFLPYGNSVTLRSGDIIVLGGTAPFRFETIQYARFQFWTPFLERNAPTPGWGLLIDGRSRTVTPLERAEHFLSVRNGAIVPLEDEGKDAVLVIRLAKNGVMTVQSLSDSIESLIELKEDDHNYRHYRLKPGIAYYRMQQYGEWASLFAATFIAGDARFQVLPIDKDLEPSQ
jgi:hypothetical protein